ncbi:hypothetical protein FPV67DRAFT_1482611 [Lyophyllum atratum]|nr:hypothetical protein FPV67DRAFT_1482611 [Lyophyllum atratum]
MTGHDLPTEVWLYLAQQFIPNDVMSDLLGVNRLFFNLAMDIRYREIEFDDVTPKAMRMLSQLRDSSIARRVRRLELQLNQLARLKHAGPRAQSPPSSRGIRQRLTTALLHPHLSLLSVRPPQKSGASASPFAVTFEALIEDLTAVLPAMVNVEEFSVDSWNLPTKLDLQPFFSAAWLGFGTRVRKLSLGGNIGGFKVLLASQPVLTAVEELHLEFTNNMNPPMPNSTEAFTVAATTQTLLHDFVAPFINDLGSQLQVLKLWSWASIDLSSFFRKLGPFPLLHTLSVWAAFNRSFTNDPSGLTQVLYGTSPTLKDLMLRLNPSGLFDPQSDLILCDWLTEIIQNNDKFATGLRSLQLYPSATNAGLEALVAFIQRSADTLEGLNVRDRYLLLPEIITITAAFSPYAKLRFLRLNVRKLPVELFDLFAQSFPDLKTLALRAADGEPGVVSGSDFPPCNLLLKLFQDFATGLQTRKYDEWNLHDIGIWQGGNELEYEMMLLLRKCIPSIGSFWGQGSISTNVVDWTPSSLQTSVNILDGIA